MGTHRLWNAPTAFIPLPRTIQPQFLKQHRVGDATFSDTPATKIKGSEKLPTSQAFPGSW